LIGREFGGNYNVLNLNLCHVATSNQSGFLIRACRMVRLRSRLGRCYLLRLPDWVAYNLAHFACESKSFIYKDIGKHWWTKNPVVALTTLENHGIVKLIPQRIAYLLIWAGRGRKLARNSLVPQHPTRLRN
jgi:hypothetical protein